MPLAQVWIGKPLRPQALAVLAGVANVVVSTVGERNDWYAEASTADAIIVEGATFVTGEVMDRIGPHLRIIARTGIGVDRVDLDAATQRGIMVINTPEGPTESTAEQEVPLIMLWPLSKFPTAIPGVVQFGALYTNRVAPPSCCPIEW